MPKIADKYGAHILTRTSEIEKKVRESNNTYDFEVMGGYRPLKKISIRIGLPVYRIENGRTKTFQKEYLALHPDVPRDLFERDTDASQAQKAQHEILKELVEDEDLLKEFKSGTKQTEPIIVTSTGVVVNGNRRLCAWRTLYYNDPERFKHFEFINVAVLPNDCDDLEIRKIEKKLQIQKTLRAEYKWHNKAAMMQEEIKSGVSAKELANTYSMREKDVNQLIDAFDYADKYLKEIGKKDQWSLVDKSEYAFKKIVDSRKRIPEQGRKELFEAICFKIIKEGKPSDRLYDVIPDIPEILDSVISNIPLPQKEEILENDQVLNEDENIDLLGGEDIKKDKYSELASALKNCDIQISSIIENLINEKESLDKEKESAGYLLGKLSQVSGILSNLLTYGLRENTKTNGSKEQINMIREKILEIEKWIDMREGK